jgi:hypothetical protein
MVFRVVIEPGEDGDFAVLCPSLKSCWSQGKTREVHPDGRLIIVPDHDPDNR